MRHHARGLTRVVAPIASVAFVLLCWELAPRIGVVRSSLVPPFSAAAVEAAGILASADFFQSLQASATRWSVGFGVAVVVGVTLGIIVGRSRVAFYLVDPVVTLGYPVPRAAFILILVLWFGVGLVSMAGVIAFSAAIPVIIASYHGARGVQPHLVWAARALGTSRPGILGKVVLPAALPDVLSGVRIAITISIFTLLGSELLIRQDGIGAELFRNWDNAQYEAVWGYAAIIAVIGFALDLIFVRAVRALVPWLEGEI